MTKRLVLDYVASRDRVPVWPRSMPWGVTAQSPGEALMQLRPGPMTGGLLPGLPRPKGHDPRAGGLGSEMCLNADAAELMGVQTWGYDEKERALLMHAYPMHRAQHRRLGSPAGKAHFGCQMHTMHQGMGYGRIEVVHRSSGQPGAFEAAAWGIFQGANPVPANGQGYLELDVTETLGHQRDRIYQTMHRQEYDLAPDGSIQRDAKGLPKHKARSAIGKPAQVDFDIAADFHEYALEWDADTVRWFIDGKQTQELPTPVSGRGKRLVLISGVAVGANPDWSRGPDGSTEWPIVSAIRSFRAWEA